MWLIVLICTNTFYLQECIPFSGPVESCTNSMQCHPCGECVDGQCPTTGGGEPSDFQEDFDMEDK